LTSPLLDLTVVFDLDGTLADTAPDLAGAMNAVLVEAGRPALPVDHVRRMVGRGARILIETGFKATGAAVDGAQLDAMLSHFLEHYAENIDRTSKLFPGAREAVAALKADGCRVGVCTNKPIALTELLLERLDFRSPFGSVRGADSAPYKKPDPQHFFDVVDDLGGDRTRAVLIGDSETDAKTARAAGVPCILVRFGYTEIPVDDLGGDIVIDDFAQLHGALRTLFL
jgi:phosphoglycolate phosphatase